MDKELELVIEIASPLESFARDRKNYSDDSLQANREEILLKETIKDSKKHRTKIYQLKNKTANSTLGIIALSASRLDFKPALVIDYIFIANQFRERNSAINYAQYLILFAFEKGLKLQKEIGVSNLILYPDNEEDNLIDYYKKRYGFLEIREHIAIQKKVQFEKWLYLPLKEK